jgi:hypothetical protein
VVTGANPLQVNALSRQTHIVNAMKHGGVGAVWARNTYAIVFFAGKVAEYRGLAADWPRVRRCALPTAFAYMLCLALHCHLRCKAEVA